MKRYWPVLAILILGLFLRVYKPLQLFMYGHDQDLAGWIIKDIVVNHHYRLIGQETSSQGIFIGPLFYYLQIPFYLLTRMDPSGSIILVTLLGLFSIFSFYYCFSKIFGKRVGLIAAFIYAVAIYFINTDRDIVPTMPVHLWTVWFLYGTWLILKGRSRAYILLGFLAGILWNFNLALAIVVPLVLVAQMLSKSKINLKYLFLGMMFFIILMSPFFVFEARHSFRQTRAMVSSLTTSKDLIPGTGVGFAKLDRVMQLVRKNTSSLVWGSNNPISYSWTFNAFVVLFAFLIFKKIISRRLSLLFVLWQIMYLAFFTLNSINISEYYLNGMNVVWIAIISLGISLCTRKMAILLLFLFACVNIYSFFTRNINRSGYLERKSIVKHIKEDALKNGYPCVSVSYITSPGNNLGYRYLFWLENMHVNQPSSLSPVYTIVYPHSMVDRIDKSFGALGLILPEYNKYNKESVAKSCEGENQNVTGSMFGYTQ